MNSSTARRRIIVVGVLLFSSVLLLSLLLPWWGRFIAGRDPAREVVPFATPSVPQQGTVIDPPRPMEDWTLTSHTGQPLHLTDLRGKAILLFFGYTSCPDVCPTTLADFVQVKQGLGSVRDQLAVVFISVDSARDTPERLARYVAAFDPSFIGATGSDEALQAMGKDYGLYFARQSVAGTSAGYLVDHTSASYLIDPAGRERMIYSFNTPAAVVTKDVLAILDE